MLVNWHSVRLCLFYLSRICLGQAPWKNEDINLKVLEETPRFLPAMSIETFIIYGILYSADFLLRPRSFSKQIIALQYYNKIMSKKAIYRKLLRKKIFVSAFLKIIHTGVPLWTVLLAHWWWCVCDDIQRLRRLQLILRKIEIPFSEIYPQSNNQHSVGRRFSLLHRLHYEPYCRQNDEVMRLA